MTHNSRLNQLEKQAAPARSPRLIVLNEGEYQELGEVISEADYQAIINDPSNDVTLINVEYVSEAQPVSTITNGDYSVTVGLDMEEI